MLTKTQVKIILILLDNAGHAEWEIAELLGREDSNLNRLLKELAKMKIIYRGKPRLSKREHKKKGDYNEIPYYLEKDLETIKYMIREIIQTNLLETWFIFKIIRESKYLEVLNRKFKAEVDAAIGYELQFHPSIFQDTFYKNLINHGQGLCLSARPLDPEKDEIQCWYYWEKSMAKKTGLIWDKT
jgi:predicted transcriptional regulator